MKEVQEKEIGRKKTDRVESTDNRCKRVEKTVKVSQSVRQRRLVT